jgi:hypothetical protein
VVASGIPRGTDFLESLISRRQECLRHLGSSRRQECPRHPRLDTGIQLPYPPRKKVEKKLIFKKNALDTDS